MKTRRDIASTEGETGLETSTERALWVRCARCEDRIAKVADRIAVNGKDEHEFMNPSGLRYVVVCYADAPGCTPEGARSSVWTWFPGHAWQIEACAGCRSHLGWSFHGSAVFYGLIKDAIAIA